MNLRAAAVAACCFLLCFAVEAQVPQLINYQGRIAVGTTNFSGVGNFKFALVNGIGTISYWSNDGTSVGGSQPTNAVPLLVDKGLYSVLLGNNMLPIPFTVFNNSDVRLRVWFNDGINGFQQLTPDQRLSAVGYAAMSNSVVNGAITSAKLAAGAVQTVHLANGAVGAQQLGAGAVQSGHIANGAVSAQQLAAGAAAANLAADGLSAVPSGGFVLSANPADAALLAQGYVAAGASTVQTAERGWRIPASGETDPFSRSDAGTVWTGSEMIIWGGGPSTSPRNDGGRYNPATDTWTPISTTGAPAARTRPSAVWTGDEMIVWGGMFQSGSTVYVDTGGRYNPATNSWSPMSTVSAPSARAYHTAVWTGTEMIIWGGGTGSSGTNTGARYSPASDSWTPVSTTSAPAARTRHTAVWTGSEMIIWGGGSSNTGSRYNPTTDTWTALPTTGAPAGRWRHTAVWTGSDMIVWGGEIMGEVNTGGRFNLASGSWASTATSGLAGGRVEHSAIWTGSEMIIWGGQWTSGPIVHHGARYDPARDSWTAVTHAGAPPARAGHSAVWTGTQMLIWGGGTVAREVGHYGPPVSLYLYLRP